MKKCCVLGLGYIGLPTAICIAKAGYKVIGVDINSQVIDKINAGKLHIKEPGLKEHMSGVIKSGNLKAQLSPCKADIFLIAVPTPIIKEKSELPKPNINYVKDAINSIIDFLSPGNLILIESTSPVGITDLVTSLISKSIKFDASYLNICYCPERVIPGNIIHELINNDRIIGSKNESSSKLAKEFYQSFWKGKIHLTNSNTAEMVKLVENSYRDNCIAFANEISMVCESQNINVWETIELANLHPRVNILNPSCGVGGHCIAVDPWFIVDKEPTLTSLIQQSRKTNLKKTDWVVEQIINESKKFKKANIKNPKVGLLGLSYKPNVDDFRESPALEIAEKLKNHNLDLIICEPNATAIKGFKLSSINFLLEKSDIVVGLVKHDGFLNQNYKNKLFLDICGITK